VLIIILGIFIGLVTGVVQFYLLYKFITSVTGGKGGTRTLIFGITQFLFPFAILLLCGFLLTDSLMWVGIGAGSALIISAVIRFVFASKFDDMAKNKSKEKAKNNKKAKKEQ